MASFCLPLSPMLRALLVLVLLLTMADRPSSAQQLSDRAQVSLITILPGDAVYSLWGHSALRIYDPASGIDIAYNYGTFDFGNPFLFVARFAYGELDYTLSVQSYPALATASWHVQKRTVIEQILRMNPSQKEQLFRFLQTNALPANRTYRYDFLFDNCSTRIRDALERIMADSLSFTTGPSPTRSFRKLVDAYATRQPFLDLLMDLGMGLPADRTATPRERMFLPSELSLAFGEANVATGGRWLPLVVSTDTVYAAPLRSELPPAWPWPSILGWILCIAGLLVTIGRWRFPWRYVDSMLFGITGVAGLLTLFLWFVSLHGVSQPNFNVLWAWPTHLVIAWPLLRRRMYPWLRIYLSVTTFATPGVLLFLLLLPQYIPGSIIPLLLLLAMRAYAIKIQRYKTQKACPLPEQALQSTAYGI